MELKSGATFDAKIRDVDEKADIALIKIDAPVSSLESRGNVDVCLLSSEQTWGFSVLSSSFEMRFETFFLSTFFRFLARY